MRGFGVWGNGAFTVRQGAPASWPGVLGERLAPPPWDPERRAPGGRPRRWPEALPPGGGTRAVKGRYLPTLSAKSLAALALAADS